MCIITCFVGGMISLQVSKNPGGILTKNKIKYNSIWLDVDDTNIIINIKDKLKFSLNIQSSQTSSFADSKKIGANWSICMIYGGIRPRFSSFSLLVHTLLIF